MKLERLSITQSVWTLPDIGLADQLTFIVRHVLPDGKPAERFMRFIEIYGHGAENKSGVVTKILADPLTHLVPCAAYSLNLVGSSNSCSCVGATSFLSFF